MSTVSYEGLRKHADVVYFTCMYICIHISTQSEQIQIHNKHLGEKEVGPRILDSLAALTRGEWTYTGSTGNTVIGESACSASLLVVEVVAAAGRKGLPAGISGDAVTNGLGESNTTGAEDGGELNGLAPLAGAELVFSLQSRKTNKQRGCNCYF